MKGENNNVFDIITYQSSINKRELFTKYQLYNFFMQIFKRFQEILNVKIRKTYFFYIFDINENNAINYCENNDIFYIIYDLFKGEFIKKGKQNIGEIFKHPINIMEIKPTQFEENEFSKKQICLNINEKIQTFLEK